MRRMYMYFGYVCRFIGVLYYDSRTHGQIQQINVDFNILSVCHNRKLLFMKKIRI